MTRVYSRGVCEILAGLGSALRHARLQAGLTQSEVSRLAGVSRQLVSRIENGHPSGEIAAVVAVASALGQRLTVVDEVPLNESEQAALDLAKELQRPPGPAERPVVFGADARGYRGEDVVPMSVLLAADSGQDIDFEPDRLGLTTRIPDL